MAIEDLMNRNAFPDEPLDANDRQIIQILYAQGPKGMGFNKLVANVAPSVSRSTLALRVRRLARLGYVERIPTRRAGQVKPVRISFKCHSLMSTLKKLKTQSEELSQDLAKLDSMGKSREHGGLESKANSFRKWYDEYLSKFNGLFGMTGSVAVLYGTAAAGDLFLPLIVEDYRRLWTQFMAVMRNNPDLMTVAKNAINTQLETGGTNIEEIKREIKKEAKEWSRELAPRSRSKSGI
ncbi:MAG: hypothetical protein OK422_00095 [Thaumarchaeota archaeon]|nr:hypothetical protein [Nitrososphaerota archaeon]